MFLKSIEIRGFKSFANKTELVFKKGITAVVGPNGSGKSNISDAVRWVLGEQSIKSLRGGKMEDVIFAGTQFRKPVSLAQVSLTLDNACGELAIDYSEVTVSRRLYRSGESEYRLNNTQCRLKDIQELFMDTGIGKEGYSIIGQGKIDAILSGKPEERRNLLEEAAGIVKFRSRKEEAEKKLQNTDQNFIRINDIISTYEERLEPLRIENEKAKVFIKLSKELKEKEVSVIIDSIDNMENKVKNLNVEANLINKTTEELNLCKNKYKENLSCFNEKLADHEVKTEQEKEEYYDFQGVYQGFLSNTNLLKERIYNFTNLINKSAIEFDGISGKVSDAKESKYTEGYDLRILNEEQSKLNAKIDIEDEDLLKFNSIQLKDDILIKKLKVDEIEILNDISSTKNEMNLILNNKDSLENKMEQFKMDCKSHISSIKINNTTKCMLENKFSDIEERVNILEKNINHNKDIISKTTKDLLLYEENIKELSVITNKLEANHHMLGNLDKQYEGYNKAVKLLMQHIERGDIDVSHNNCYVLGEIINVKKELEIAIEIALGGSISDVITNDETMAKKLINYLKTNKLGRATFLPLNIIKGRRISNLENIKNIKGFLGTANELISYEGKFTKALEYALGRIIISENMDSALNIAKVGNYNFKIVTLAGEVINSGGSLTGGSLFHKTINIIGRKKEIEKIMNNITVNNVQLKVLVKESEDKKSLIKGLDIELLNLRDDVYNENIEKTKISGKINVLEEETEKLNQNIKTYNNEMKIMLLDLSSQSIELKLKHSYIKAHELKGVKNQEEIYCLESALNTRSNEIQEKRDRVTTLKIKKAKLDEMRTNKIRELERLTKELDEIITRKRNLQREIEEAKINNEQSIRDGITNDDNIKVVLEQINNLEDTFKDNEFKKVQFKDKIKEIGEELEKLSNDIIKKEEEKHKSQLVLTKISTEKDGLYQKLNEELELTYAEALEYKLQFINTENFKKDIVELKNNIGKLGLINLAAIEEYKEIKEKFAFMTSQRDDLINAKEELSAVINGMTESMRKVFSENLIILRKNFNETFKELFSGGYADLILSSGDELSGNIDINVEPPGKRLQNINLMSGGEKVLSAIALLFAILKMKPTPFCILDEIEAALDDANVFRYAEFLKKFSNNIQFIVITHRKGTMEYSDVLYGVTMEEKGVSKIVSVDLSKQ